MLGGSSSSVVKFSIRASPLPATISDFVLQNLAILKKLQSDHKSKDTQESVDKHTEDPHFAGEMQSEIVRIPGVAPENFWTTLDKICQQQGGEWADIMERIWAFGPQKVGGCLLIDARQSTPSRS